ncbi:CTRL protease, partial [Nothocercus julius]|nr:CTRL protease [Nothocercus julius]
MCASPASRRRYLSASSVGCGVPSISPWVQYSEKIANGQNAASGSWPWQASLHACTGSHFRSGSLIDDNWVITAAFCEFNPYAHAVVLGEYDQYSGAEAIQVKTVAKTRPYSAPTHPGCNANTFNNGITLLKLSWPAQPEPRVAPVCLPTSSAETVLLGQLNSAFSLSSPSASSLAQHLQQAVLPLISTSQCMQHWGNHSTASMLCAAGVWTLIGIVSWGNHNCNARSPAVYARGPAVYARVSQLRSRT